MKRWILILLTTVLSISTLIFGSLCASRLAMKYNSEGNFFDEAAGVVYHQQAVDVFGAIFIFLLVLTILVVWQVKKFNKRIE